MEQHLSNIPELGAREIAISPNLFGQEGEFRQFCRRLTRQLAAGNGNERQQVIERARDEVQTFACGPTEKPKLALKFACSVMLDVVAQGWTLKPGRKNIQIRTPALE